MYDPKKPSSNITLEDVKMFSLNFSGHEAAFNPKGKRNFCVFLPSIDMGRDMEDDGWPVKWLKAKEEYDEPEKPFMKVKVAYTKFPPRIVLISKKGKNQLEEDTVGILDGVHILNCDMVLNPWHYDFNGKKGVTVYAKAVYVTIELDELEEKYYDVPASVISSLPEANYVDDDDNG